jgi:hypothetical protein
MIHEHSAGNAAMSMPAALGMHLKGVYTQSRHIL